MTSHQISRPASFARVAAIAVSVLLLVGCAGAGTPGSNPEGSGSAGASISATPTPTPTPTQPYKPASASGPAENVPVPVLPAVAKTQTKEGLEAFTRYWFQVLSYAYETGDIKPLKSVSDPGCVFCNGLIKNVSNAWSEGQWISGGKIQTPAITAQVLENEPWQATIQVIQAPVNIHKSDGKLLQAPTKQTNTGSQGVARFGPHGWTLIELGLIR